MSLALLNIRIVEHNIKNIKKHKHKHKNSCQIYRSCQHSNTIISTHYWALFIKTLQKAGFLYVEVSFSKPEKRRRAVLAVRSIN